MQMLHSQSVEHKIDSNAFSEMYQGESMVHNDFVFSFFTQGTS